jgi:hypothetical protein
MPQLQPTTKATWADVWGDYRHIPVQMNYPHPVIVHYMRIDSRDEYEAIEYTSKDASDTAWKSILRNFTPSILEPPTGPRTMPDIKHVYAVNGVMFEKFDDAQAYALRYRKGEL